MDLERIVILFFEGKSKKDVVMMIRELFRNHDK